MVSRGVLWIRGSTGVEVMERLMATDPNRAGSSRVDGEAKAKKGATVYSKRRESAMITTKRRRSGIPLLSASSR